LFEVVNGYTGIVSHGDGPFVAVVRLDGCRATPP
jgi:hypothetical protein